MKKPLIFLAVTLLAVVSIFTPAVAEAETQTLKVGITKDENGLNPYTYVTGYPGLDLVNLLYDNLFVLDEDNQPQPWLVKEYNVSEDGLTYEFELHDNVTWHDGESLTAEDVKFTMEYFIQYPKSRFTNPLKSIASIDISDDTTFSLTLSEADPNFMIQPLGDLPILPEHIWSQVNNPDEETNAIGSGPYILEEHKSGQYYKVRAHKDYFHGEPPIEEIIFPIIEDTTAMLNALQAGEIDALSSSISPELVEQFESNSSLKVARGPGYSTTLFQINAEKYPMTESAFRQAINFAVDKNNLVETLLLGYGEVGSPGFIHPSSPFYNNELEATHNPEKAKQLLEDAGFKDIDGDGFREDPNGDKIDLTTLVYANNPIRIRTAELVSEAINGIGIKNTVKAMDATTVDSLMWPDFDVTKGRDYDMGVWGWSNTMQLFPDRMVELFHSDPTIGSVNIGAYKNAEFDTLSEELSSTFDEDERMTIIKDMQSIVATDAPFITLYYQEIVNAYNPSVYDGYVFQVGKGIINKLSFVSGEKSEIQTTDKEDVATADSTSEGSTEGGANSTLFILGGIILMVIIAFYFIKRKGKSKPKDEFDI
ncbi:ABC transporter substrate-binding protein [Bacillus tianshenii]|uniref:ABC transporter substrate-binding protein n=1 Tax=Sutcliffiella tianshenii TaxID=1463404 RepID=UPI001CD67667|nr:ABC transporter substrate-binding protein [Bacillus tianshenii]MCA1321460.1 ABC transporter substrate-binding protein [Bacillus tianshenii]